MKSGICPKCSAEIVRRIKYWYPAGSDAIRISFFGTVRLTHYVCGACGYHESYVENFADLGTIAERGQLVAKLAK